MVSHSYEKDSIKCAQEKTLNLIEGSSVVQPFGTRRDTMCLTENC